jgi:hypothetical protein
MASSVTFLKPRHTDEVTSPFPYDEQRVSFVKIEIKEQLKHECKRIDQRTWRM